MHRSVLNASARKNRRINARPARRAWSPWFVSLIVCLVDQATKFIVVHAFSPNQSLPVIVPFFHLTYVQNTGAAFGLFKGQQWLFLACSLFVIIWIIKQLLKKGSGANLENGLTPFLRVAYALVLGGAAGNLIDRVRLSYVIDFLDFRVWPVFNVGDSAITIGIALLIWNTLVQPKK